LKAVLKNIIICLSIILTGLTSCKNSNENTGKILRIEDDGIESTGPYLTKDNKGNAVLCWMSKSASDSLYRLKYAVFDSLANQFGSSFTVSSSAGTSYSAESMGKIAFKADGTVIVVFSKKFENEKNPYAGAIYYSTSKDGKNWTSASFLHSDTSHAYGRNFFDIATIGNGEIAAIWLDGRFGKTEKGSALFFAATEKAKGFGIDTCINKSTCECCRTDLLCDDKGLLHLAYRSISYPSELMGAQVRDMVYITSADNGKHFTVEKPISKDNWKLEGCPHSGPSLAVSSKKINAVWFTAAAGKPGLYFSNLSDQSSFGKRSLISANGRHPQLTSIQNKAIVVYEDSENAASMPQHHSMSMNHHQAASKAKIVLEVLGDGSDAGKMNITDGAFADHHAVIASQNGNALVAWIREDNGRSTICYTLKHINNEE